LIYLWSILASLLALAQEALFVRFSYASLLPWIIILAISINFVIYKLVNSSDTLVGAFVVFSAVNLLARTAITMFLGQTVSRGVWIALVLMFLAILAREKVK
jgi:hypothetical protein